MANDRSGGTQDRDEDGRWKSEPDTVEQRDRERLPTDSGTGRDAPGIANRTPADERESEEAVPPGGTSRDTEDAGLGGEESEEPAS